jgi:CRP-like cAMP-binding protein
VTRTVIIADGEIIDEYLAHALPTLTEEQLLVATRQLETQTFAPGAIIMREGAPSDSFCVITRGRVEVVLHDPGGHEIVVATWGVGL